MCYCRRYGYVLTTYSQQLILTSPSDELECFDKTTAALTSIWLVENCSASKFAIFLTCPSFWSCTLIFCSLAPPPSLLHFHVFLSNIMFLLVGFDNLFISCRLSCLNVRSDSTTSTDVTRIVGDICADQEQTKNTL